MGGRLLKSPPLRWNKVHCSLDVLHAADGCCLLSEQSPSRPPLGNSASVHLWDVGDLGGRGWKEGIEVKGHGGSICVWCSTVCILLFRMQMSSDIVATAPWGLPVCVGVWGRYPRTGVRGQVLHWGQTGPERERDEVPLGHWLMTSTSIVLSWVWLISQQILNQQLCHITMKIKACNGPLVQPY